MKVCIYARVSTSEQDLKQQIEACNRFCQLKELEVGRVFSDYASGKDFLKRPGFFDMLAALRRYEYNGVVVFRIDRLGRDVSEMLNFFSEMENKEIEIYSLSENFDRSTALGRAMRSLILVFAQFEREQIAEATRERLAALKASGKKLGRPKGRKDKKKRSRRWHKRPTIRAEKWIK